MPQVSSKPKHEVDRRTKGQSRDRDKDDKRRHQTTTSQLLKRSRPRPRPQQEKKPEKKPARTPSPVRPKEKPFTLDTSSERSGKQNIPIKSFPPHPVKAMESKQLTTNMAGSNNICDFLHVTREYIISGHGVNVDLPAFAETEMQLIIPTTGTYQITVTANLTVSQLHDGTLLYLFMPISSASHCRLFNGYQQVHLTTVTQLKEKEIVSLKLRGHINVNPQYLNTLPIRASTNSVPHLDNSTLVELTRLVDLVERENKFTITYSNVGIQYLQLT
jgi:hypothetical protein